MMIMIANKIANDGNPNNDFTRVDILLEFISICIRFNNNKLNISDITINMETISVLNIAFTIGKPNIMVVDIITIILSIMCAPKYMGSFRIKNIDKLLINTKNI